MITSPLPCQLVLASGSPRRQMLLKELGLPFSVRKQQADESWPAKMPVAEVAEYLACKKAEAAKSALAENELLITADTTVVLGDQLLEKAGNPEEARQMLMALSGTTHLVITGVCLAGKQQRHSFSNTTEVTFHQLNRQEIDHYIKTCQPFDKAGAYGIQEWIGMVGVKSISGSYYNVVGLPVDQLYHELQRFVAENWPL